MSEEKDKKQGFRYTLEREKIAEYMRLSPEQKLAWLEAINELNREVLSDEDMRLRQRLKEG